MILYYQPLTNGERSHIVVVQWIHALKRDSSRLRVKHNEQVHVFNKHYHTSASFFKKLVKDADTLNCFLRVK